MKAKVTGVEERQSHQGGMFYHIFFKGEDGKAYLTNAYPKYKTMPMRNFPKWQRVMDAFGQGMGEVWLDNLKIIKGKTIDADSDFSMRVDKK